MRTQNSRETVNNLVTLKSLRPLFLPFVAIIAVAVIRQLWWLYDSNLRGPLGFAGITLIVCPFLVISLTSVGVLSFIVVRSVTQTKSLLPTLFLASGIFLTFQIPLPPRPDTPEKLHFLQYRTDYEAVVEMARNSELEQALPNCPAGFLPPEHFSHVSAAGCMSVDWDEERGLSVLFNPIEPFYHPVVYVELDNAKNPCGYDSHVEQRVDEHWYICELEWN